MRAGEMKRVLSVHDIPADLWLVEAREVERVVSVHDIPADLWQVEAGEMKRVLSVHDIPDKLWQVEGTRDQVKRVLSVHDIPDELWQVEDTSDQVKRVLSVHDIPDELWQVEGTRDQVKRVLSVHDIPDELWQVETGEMNRVLSVHDVPNELWTSHDNPSMNDHSKSEFAPEQYLIEDTLASKPSLTPSTPSFNNDAINIIEINDDNDQFEPLLPFTLSLRKDKMVEINDDIKQSTPLHPSMLNGVIVKINEDNPLPPFTLSNNMIMEINDDGDDQYISDPSNVHPNGSEADPAYLESRLKIACEKCASIWASSSSSSASVAAAVNVDELTMKVSPLPVMHEAKANHQTEETTNNQHKDASSCAADAKRLKRMLGNREAARRSRQKKVEMMAMLKTQYCELLDLNTYLRKHLEGLCQAINEKAAMNTQLRAKNQSLTEELKMAEERADLLNITTSLI